MNYKFSIKVAAVLATFTGTSIGSTSLVPSDWLTSVNAQQTTVTNQAHTPASSSMLAPLVPPVVKPGGSMPWKVDSSKYRSAVNASSQNRPALIDQAPASVRKNTASVPDANVLTPQVQQAGGAAMDIAKSSVQPAAATMAAPAKGQIANGFSAAGIPLYSSPASPTQAVPYMRAQATPRPNNTPSVYVARAAAPAPRFTPTSQGSGTRGTIGSGIAPGPAFPAPPVISSNSERIFAPSSEFGPSITPDSVLSQGTVIPQGPILSDPAVVPAPIASGADCSTCNTGGVGGAAGCESGGNCNCGPGGCYDASQIASQAGLYGSVGEARYYGHLEALVMDRQDGEISFTPSLQLSDFDVDAGYRVTFGERFDAVSGREFSYWGTSDISTDQTLEGPGLSQAFLTTDINRGAIAPFGFFTEAVAAVPGALPRAPGTFGPLDPGFVGSPPVVGVPSTLIQPTEQTQRSETLFHTVEANRVRWAWDVFKSFIGVRYIYASDRYELNSTATVPVNDTLSVISSGTYTNFAQNNLIGPHIGGEWFYDVGYRLSASVNLKGGVYANLNQFDTRLFTDGEAFVDNEDENTSFASSIELGVHAHYQISPRGRFRAGFNLLHLEEVATVTQNLPGLAADADGTIVRVIDRGTGSNTRDSDDMTFTGFSFGLEFFR